MQTQTATAPTIKVHHSIRRRMSDLARRSQAFNLDPRLVQGIRVALQS